MSDDYEEWHYWHYKATISQGNVAVQETGVTIANDPGSIMKIDYITWGADNYGADRSVFIQVLDEDDSVIVKPITVATVDNELSLVPLAVVDSSGIPGGENQGLPPDTILTGEDKIKARGSALVQNETFTVTVRARIKGLPPTITKIHADNVIVEAYNRFV